MRTRWLEGAFRVLSFKCGTRSAHDNPGPTHPTAPRRGRSDFPGNTPDTCRELVRVRLLGRGEATCRAEWLYDLSMGVVALHGPMAAQFPGCLVAKSPQSSCSSDQSPGFRYDGRNRGE